MISVAAWQLAGTMTGSDSFLMSHYIFSWMFCHCCHDEILTEHPCERTWSDQHPAVPPYLEIDNIGLPADHATYGHKTVPASHNLLVRIQTNSTSCGLSQLTEQIEYLQVQKLSSDACCRWWPFFTVLWPSSFTGEWCVDCCWQHFTRFCLFTSCLTSPDFLRFWTLFKLFSANDWCRLFVSVTPLKN